MGRRLSPDELDKQYRRAYPDDRLPGLGLDRNALGETGRGRHVLLAVLPKTPRDGMCRECGKPILGRPPTASTCLVHRAFTGAPDRDELMALIEEHKAVIKQLRAALREMDKEAGA